MEDRFKERISAALMGDLLVALAKREKIKEMLGDLEGWAADELIPELLDEFERIIEMRRDQVLAANPVPPPEEPLPAPTAVPDDPHQETPRPFSLSEHFSHGGATEADVRSLGLAGELAEAARQILGKSFPDAMAVPSTVPPALAEPEETTPADERGVGGEPPETAPQDPAPQLPVDVEAEASPADDRHEGSGASVPLHRPRTAVEFTDEDSVYLHAFMMVPDDEPPSSRPFMLEEKGIEDKDFAFALDHRGLRFLLSKIHMRSSHMSKTGTLLLNKQESIRLRGRHENILNELRAHGMLVPFEFGTVARGREDLITKIDAHVTDLHLAAEDMAKTGWWEVCMYALDPRIAKRPAGEHGSRPQRDRGRANFSGASTPKFDVKTLDRMLGKQKKIAESVHAELGAVADRSDVDMKIDLGGGTSQDWKLILKASYEVSPSRLPTFIRVVTDIQYRHVMSDVMLALAGEREPFSFQG